MGINLALDFSLRRYLNANNNIQTYLKTNRLVGLHKQIDQINLKSIYFRDVLHVLLVMQNMESTDVSVWKRIFVHQYKLLAVKSLKSDKIFKLSKMNDTGNL